MKRTALARKEARGLKTNPQFRAAELVERMLHRCGVEAAVWGPPAVSFDAYRKARQLFALVMKDMAVLQTNPLCYRLISQQIGSSALETMKIRRLLQWWFCLAIFLLGLAACRTATASYGATLVAATEVRDEKFTGPLPQQLPRITYVGDFALDAEDYKRDEGVRGALPGRLGQRRPHPLARDDASDKARRIVETMAESLVDALQAKGVAAQRLLNTTGNLPREGWLVQGHFTEMDEGNRLKRAAIGFGKGAARMDLQVAISDLARSDPLAAFAVFGTVNDPRRIPGAVVAMNPYVAAAKFVLQKNATERDIRKPAEQVAERIVKYEQEIQKPNQTRE